MKLNTLFPLTLCVALLAVCLVALLGPRESRANLPEERGIRYPQLKGDGELALHNLKNGETVNVRYRDSEGGYDHYMLEAINKSLRCRWKGEMTMMDLGLVELLDDIQDHFGAQMLHVVSGYRSPEFNEHLASIGRKVAKSSLHMKGMATDIRIPGVSTKELREYAKALKVGGVGFYPEDGFVHVDVGRVRYW